MIDAIFTFIFGFSVALLLLTREEENFDLVRRMLFGALALVVLSLMAKIRFGGFGDNLYVGEGVILKSFILAIAGFLTACAIMFFEDRVIQDGAKALKPVTQTQRKAYQFSKHKTVNAESNNLLGTSSRSVGGTALDMRSDIIVRLSLYVFGRPDRRVLALIEKHLHASREQSLAIQRIVTDTAAQRAGLRSIVREYKLYNGGNHAASRGVILNVAQIAQLSGQSSPSVIKRLTTGLISRTQAA